MKKPIIFIAIILLLLVSGIAAAGFWQDITGMFSLSKLFKPKAAQQTILPAEKAITTECKAYIDGKCATELHPKLNMNLQKTAKAYTLEMQKSKTVSGKAVKISKTEKTVTHNVIIGTQIKIVKVPVVNVCINNKCKDYGIDENIDIAGVVYDMVLVKDNVNLIPKGVPLIRPHEEDISKMRAPQERFIPKTYGPPPFGAMRRPSPHIFKIGVIIDRDTVPTPQASREEIQEAIRLANNKLLLRSTNIQFELQDVVELNMGHYAPEEWGPTPEFAYIDNYYLEHTSSPPNGVVIFREDPAASLYGGYGGFASSDLAGYGFCNNFSSPIYGSSFIYGSVLDWNHMYAACGYDDYENHISDVSIVRESGTRECYGLEGIPCILHNGYYMCNNTDFENDEYAQHRLSFLADSIIHEFLHSFHEYSSTMFHYNSPDCPGLDSSLSQLYSGMCPAVWDTFTRSWHRCSSSGMTGTTIGSSIR